jgi:hypothetical protein
MNIAAKGYFGLVREARSVAILHESVRDERQVNRPKEFQPGGFLQKPSGDFIVSSGPGGYAPSSRLIDGPVLQKQQYRSLLNGLIGVANPNSNHYQRLLLAP